ncbi:lactonase family protein [Halobacteria archaeon AArc-m2/3/4]|uniref:Lactonase family protein n=1 Tax=Natronoglomus mannanivorans TaxID=2979990 RepID=A0AAP3E2C6_9EURY|nr:lactonase family protein [Halobacteria archaeon AArc-xg1-1]MCU4973469.1 lactonase family protein [Halobacteria archaeon AArc-m2/3/4]
MTDQHSRSRSARSDSPLVVIASGAGDEDGAVHGYRLDRASGHLTHVTTTPVDNPSFLAIGPDGNTLYAVERIDGGTVSAFRFDGTTGDVDLLDRRSSEGTGPCYVSVDGDGRYVYAANYRGGTVAMFPIGDDGRLEAACDVVEHDGTGSDPDRQAAPHPHFVASGTGLGPGPANQFIYVPDLGTDRIAIYRPDFERGRLRPADPPATHVHDGAGPRHLAFHPDGRFAYVVGELDSTVTALECDRETGALETIDTVSTLHPEFDGENAASDIHVHPSGRWAYVTNRGHDSVASFAIDDASGRLRPIDHESTRGETPRTFGIDPAGHALLVGNQHGESVVTMAVDPESGELEAVAETAVPKPVCVTVLE